MGMRFESSALRIERTVMRKLTILCDMDEIIVDLLGHWLNLYHVDSGHLVHKGQVDMWEMEKLLPPGTPPEAILKYLKQPGFFLKAPPMPGAIESIRLLMSYGHEVIIVTSQAGHESAAEKLYWIEEHMPFFPMKNIFLGHLKYKVKGDVLIDDGPHNIEPYRKNWPNSFIATIALPYNRRVKHLCDVYAEDWSTPETAWDTIREEILDYARMSRWQRMIRRRKKLR